MISPKDDPKTHPLVQVVADRTKDGHTSGSMARNLGISETEVWSHLAHAVILGFIRWSDVLLNYDECLHKSDEDRFECEPRRVAIVRMALELDHHHAKQCSPEELALFWCLSRRRVLVMDTFDLLTSAERVIHEQVGKVLYIEFRDDWWRKGVPKTIREKCAKQFENTDESNPDPELYDWTTLIDLSEIISSNWAIFQNAIPIRPKSAGMPVKRIKSEFADLNFIRNRIMHPTRAERGDSHNDYRFVRAFHEFYAIENWRPTRRLPPQKA